MSKLRSIVPGLLLLFALCAFAQDPRVVTFHFGEGGGPDATFAQGINNLRQVSGYIGGEILTSRGFVWQNGSFIDMFTVGPPSLSRETHVFGINDLGDTVGNLVDVSGGSTVTKGFFRSKYGNVTFLNLVSGQFTAIPSGINDSRRIVGAYFNTSTKKTYGFLRFRNGAYVTISHAGSGITSAEAINESGTIVGFYQNTSTSPEVGFVYRNGHIASTFQCSINGVSRSTEPRGINNWGQIVGRCGDQNFVRDRFGHITIIDLRSLGKALDPVVTGINDHGDIVGSFNPGAPISFGRFSFVIYHATKPF